MTVIAPPTPTDELPGSRHRRRTSWGLRLGLVFLLVVGTAIVAGVRYYTWCQRASGPQTPVTFTVPEGSSGSEIVKALHEEGVIRCGTVSTWLLRSSGLQDQIRAGTYDLTTNMVPDVAFEALTKAPPPVQTVRLTIPEGYRLTQIAERVQEEVGIPESRFMRALEDGNWSLPPYLPGGTDSPEGFLFPQTYQIVKGTSDPNEVIQRLLDQFATEVEGLNWQNAEQLDATPYEIVTIASMIEKEAKVPQDRPLIAGVIYNRIRAGMTLGIDATLLYEDPTPDGQLSASDLESDSPYNTRIQAGLPPTPIASPGLASLEAALNPAKTDYLYYVLCGADGHHEFSVTYEQHLAAVQRCLG